ncbi:MAG TPA: RNA polymerase sigma-70 factor [Puia sp.]|jgi:RNA polymerase sigma-70 factor (ECF subfamily)
MKKKSISPEAGLMEGFRQGRESAFTELFTSLYPALCFYALKITNDQAAAEDIAEESFIRVWEKREIFFQFSVLKSYLYTTVRNAGINWLYENRKYRNLQNELGQNTRLSEGNPLELIIHAELFREMYSALDKLPPKCRQIVTMLFIEGKKVKDVARELQLSTGTIQTQKTRGLMLLRKYPLNFLLLLGSFLYSSGV